jgi:hypothetical protein
MLNGNMPPNPIQRSVSAASHWLARLRTVGSILMKIVEELPERGSAGRLQRRHELAQLGLRLWDFTLFETQHRVAARKIERPDGGGRHGSTRNRGRTFFGYAADRARSAASRWERTLAW